MASQFSTVRGKKPRYNYVDAINAQAQYLPAQYANKKSTELDEKRFELDKGEAAAYKQHLTDMDKFRQSELALMEKQGKQSKKDSRYANMIGVGKLGTDIYFANKASKVGGAPALKEVIGGSAQNQIASGALASSPTQSLLGKATDWITPNQGVGALFGAGALGSLKGALNPQNMLLGGGAGMLASNLLTDKDDKWWKKAGIGAAAGGVANYLGSGGDLFSSAIGAAFGGGGGLFDFGF